MTSRPHLILDGAFLAARAVRAKSIVLYIGEGHHAARQSMTQALMERTEAESRLVRTVSAPARYVAGTSSAAVHLVNEGIATPLSTPPSAHVRGIDGAPTLVQNVETRARRADRADGRVDGHPTDHGGWGRFTPGSSGSRHGRHAGRGGQLAGGASEPAQAVLLGGYFGSWINAARAWTLPLDPEGLRAHGLSLGCGVIGVLPTSRCAVCEVAGIMRYLATESSAQCGPCFLVFAPWPRPARGFPSTVLIQPICNACSAGRQR